MHPLFRKVSELRESRDEWIGIAQEWEKLCVTLNDECDALQKERDDLQTLLTYGSNNYKVERDKAFRVLGKVLIQLSTLRRAAKELLSLHDAGYGLPPTGVLDQGDVRHEAWNALREALDQKTPS